MSFDFEVDVIRMINSSLGKDESKVCPRICYYRGDSNSDRRLYVADGYLPNGCKKLRIPARCIIEIKERLFSKMLMQYIRIFEAIKEYNDDIEYFLILYQETPNIPEYLHEDIHFGEEIGLQFKGIKDLQAEINYERDGETNVGWKEIRQDRLLAVKKRCCGGKNTFFLGSGVGVSMGLPSWEDFMRNIYEDYKILCPKEEREFENMKSDCWNSLIIMARSIRSFIEEEYGNGEDDKSSSKFLDIVRKALYDSQDVTKDSGLIKVIGDGVIKKRIDSIITYNYDDLIESYLENEMFFNYSSIYFGRRKTKPSDFPIYHVHGIVRKDEEQKSGKPVLCEDDYHEIYKEAYLWSNVVQLYALSYTTCFFVGLSMVDPNLRRLLDIAPKGDESCRHFAFLKRETDEKRCNTIENLLKSFGISIIWCEDYDELPELIDSILKRLYYRKSSKK